MIKRNRKTIIFGFVSTVVASLLMSTNLHARSNESSSNTSKSVETEQSRIDAYRKLSQIMSIVEEQYVDDVNTSALVNKALKGMFSNLDAHSSFMNEKEFEELNIQTSGEFGGLGITVGMKDEALTVIAPLEGTPADRAGIKAGDIIVKINSDSTIGMTIDKAVSLMRGKPKTPISLTIVRKGEIKPLVLSMDREIIKIESVYTKMIGKDILYVRVVSFDQKIASEVKKAMDSHKGVKGIVLDLRNNPGGLLDQAVGLVDLFVDKGVIVSQKGKIKTENISYKATASSSDDLKTPLTILVNDGSASASEIVSGALQDFGRGVVIGTKTFGKGSVQVVMPIGNKEALRLTIARYYLPSGRTIQAVGVTPDVEVLAGEIKKGEEGLSIKERDLQQHLQNELAKVDDTEAKKIEKEDKNIISDEKLYKDAQLKSAVDIIKALSITNR
ncbi:MAG: peptidase S41 [Sulfurovum sp. AS07-7]|nr:MAG: peptidase S41 [Sulfurovum sp. AS07-7]